VYFYAAGTSTPKNVWTEKEKTNPFTSKALGSDGTIQLYGEGIYKITLKDGDGATADEWDNVKLEAVNYQVVTKTGAYTATPDDDVILVDTDGGAVTISLQALANFTHPLIIKNVGSNNVVIDPNGAETIDGAATYTISIEKYAATLFAGSAEWKLYALPHSYLTDNDADTLIQLEESADEDIIRIDIGGIEQVTIQDGKIEPTTDNDIDLGATAKEFKDLFIDGVAYIDEYDIEGTYKALMPTNGVGANAVFMLGNASTIAWFYLNTAPPGWKALATGGDTVLAVSGGAGDYNVNGGNPDTGASWDNSGGLSVDSESAHTHTAQSDGSHQHSTLSGTGSFQLAGGGSETGTTGSAGAHTHSTTAGSAHTHGLTNDSSYRPSASVGKLFQLDTA
jgi:hypothetical protein